MTKSRTAALVAVIGLATGFMGAEIVSAPTAAIAAEKAKQVSPKVGKPLQEAIAAVKASKLDDALPRSLLQHAHDAIDAPVDADILFERIGVLEQLPGDACAYDADAGARLSLGQREEAAAIDVDGEETTLHAVETVVDGVFAGAAAGVFVAGGAAAEFV